MSSNVSIATFPLAVLKPKKEPRKYTLQEYLDREEQSLVKHEYYDGVIKKLPMARGPHATLSANIIGELIFMVRNLEISYYVMDGSAQIYLPRLNFSLYPDAVVISENPEYFDNNKVLLTNPLLIVEVLSKSTNRFDHLKKFENYSTLDSFREYILIDQNKCSIETRFREEPDLWRKNTYSDLNGKLVLRSIGCEIDINMIYRLVNFNAETK